MSGERAVPALDAEQLVDDLPVLAEVPELSAENVLSVPGPQMTPGQALTLARRAAAVARTGAGVVITTGTDTLEELAVLCALLGGGDGPIVLTGANRPAGHAGADGPANLLDAVAVAGARDTGGLGALVIFGGEVHDAMTARKTDSTGPAAFSSPAAGPLGRVVEGRLWLHTRPTRTAVALEPQMLDHRVEMVTAALGDDGTLLRHAGEIADGIVVVAFGAGHVTPGMWAALQGVASTKPTLLTCRPERSSMLFTTYGFDGAEPDLRDSGGISVPFLSPVAARVALLCALGAGLDQTAMSSLFAPWDAG
jgi:L-asparaginase